jgi:cell wall-associated protease
MKFNILIIIIFLAIGCKSVKESIHLFTDSKHSSLEFQTWYLKDHGDNNVPGVSLDRWYNKNNSRVKLNSIVVAVIDTQLDINHEDLQGQIWQNKKEIPNNKIDDDKNGYVDDVNGWNFIGTKSGNSIAWSNFEFVRIIREWKSLYENKTKEEIDPKNLNDYYTYNWAVAMLDYSKSLYIEKKKYLKHDIEIYPLLKDTLKYFFPKEDYTYKKLDSMYQKIKVDDRTYQQMIDKDDKDLQALVYYMMNNVEYKVLEVIKDRAVQMDSILEKKCNVDYNERTFIGDNSKILEKGYGNNKINAKILGIRSFNMHNTKVSGIIASNRRNNIGTKGFSNKIKIMPLTVSPSGDEHDKDIAMAIRYAVDNGAKVINMSFYKSFSLHKEWVFEAMQYAEKHDVLLSHSAGNEAENIDGYPNYPSDYGYDNKAAVCSNFINVGSTTKNLDSTFVSSFSNYGKKNVDLFAPGDQIYTTIPDNSYEYDSGTSLAAPMVSGTAALIWLYYPKLTVSEVKQIILDSGTAYDIDVLIPGGQGKKTKFSELSKSGTVLNVYNAMKMAEEMSKKKKLN